MGDISNTKLSKFLSVEIIGTLVLTAFGIGMSWASLDSKAKATDEKVRTLSQYQSKMTQDVNTIKTAIQIIKTEQRFLSLTIDEIKEQNKELSKIRQLLEQRR